MRRRAPQDAVGNVTLAVALALCLAAPAADAATRSPTLIRVYSTNVSLEETDKPPKGPTAGDTSVQRSRLTNAVAQFGKKVGAVVGHDEAHVVLITKDRARADGVARFPGGKLFFRGVPKAHPTGGALIPVVGGTGIFAGARGTCWVYDTTTPGLAVNVYVLRYPATA